ncbi:HD domain-containing phosphohydrolase [Planctomycetota bacterium]
MTQEQIQTKAKFQMNPMQRRELECFGRRINRLGGNFAVVSIEGQLLVMCEDSDFRSSRTRLQQTAQTLFSETDALDTVSKHDSVRIFDATTTLVGGVLDLFVPRHSPREGRTAVLIDLGDAATKTSDGLWGGSATQHYLFNQRDYLREMLANLIDCFKVLAKSDRQMEMVGGELSQVYEELVLLHKLSTNMKVTETDANFLQLACDSLTEVVPVDGIAIAVERQVEDDRQWTIAAGSGLIDLDASMAAIVHSRLSEEIDAGQEALLDSDVFSVFKYDWPETIRTIIAVPLFGKDTQESQWVRPQEQNDRIIGYMVAINAQHKRDFDSTDIKLFNTVANRCAVFIENGRLFGDLKELFMGSLRALTHSIDAKDGYTHGHSERVALISHWIAERAVEANVCRPEQVQEAYFAGLLHDIGKIGVDDWVLRKEGPLTSDELERIRNHPCIGAGILRGIKQMRDIVPGVLYHHERIDGKGYPHGLAGDQIPILARIVGLADSFDAMTSRRSYREARSVEEAVVEIERSLGSQFDAQIGRALIESDLTRLWDRMQGGSHDLYDSHQISDYGAMVMGTLIR